MAVGCFSPDRTRSFACVGRAGIGLLAFGAMLAACGDNKVPLTDAGLPADAAPRFDADPSEMQVLSTVPGANALQVGTASQIAIQFDRPVDRASITETSLWAFGQWSGSHRGTYEFSEGDSKVTLSGARPLIPGEQVTVIVANSLVSADGAGAMRPGGYSFQFRVGSTASSMNFVEIARLDSRNANQDVGQSYGGLATDLNQDGYPDITIVNETSEDLVVFMNDGDGTSSVTRADSDYLVGIRPSPSEPGDFDGDGRTDIAVANIGSGISVLLGQEGGTFAPEREYPVGAGPRGITVLDADGDGDLDIANSNSRNGGTVSILMNKGDGAFEAPIIFDGGCNGEWGIAAADMNLDGMLDLVVGCHDDGVVSVVAANGDGTFDLRSSKSGPTGLWMIVTGDLNGSGSADVTVAGGLSDNGAIYFGSPDGELGDATYYGTDPSTSATDIGDLDGDGDLDWITSSFGGDNSDWYIWLNDGTGTFTKMGEIDSPRDASCALLVDLDLDGDLDLGLIDEGADVLIIMRND